MTSLILLTLGFVTLVAAVSVVLHHGRLLTTGAIVIEDGWNGPEQVRQALIILLRIGLKRLNTVRKFIGQYLLHIFVRALYYIDRITTDLYARARNFFVKSAVQNKASVPHFWEHLKVYKQEIDKEKEENE
jgi:hypothetical protein